MFLRWLLLVVCAAPMARAQTAEEFFDRRQLQDIHIQMAPADWQQIHDRYLEDVYYVCDFRWNNHERKRIGMRSRGSQSRSPIKPSIGLDFGRFESTQRFAGMKTLVMRNLNQDASMMHEFLAEALHARLGLPHSREAFARLFVNGDYMGVYLLVEPIDARFLTVRLGEDNGYLYDMQNTSVPYRFEYLGPDPSLYVPALFDPKTNSSAPDAEGLRDMIRLINETHDNDFFNVVGGVIDLHAFVAHIAVETALANWDGLLGVNGMRNFYLYRWRESRRALFLGWDMDGAFLDASWPLLEHAQHNVLARRALRHSALAAHYRETLDLAAHAMADSNWLHHEITGAYSLIRQAVYDDRYRLCRLPEGIGRCSIEMFEADVRHLLAFAHERPRYIWAQQAGAFHHEPGAPDLRPEDVSALGAQRTVLVPRSLARVDANLLLTSTFYNNGYPLPTEIAGIRVESASGPLPLIQAGPDGVVFVVPDSLPCGPRMLRVLDQGNASNLIFVELRPSAAVVLGVTHPGGSLVSPESPAQSDAWIVAYATGVWPGYRDTPPALLRATLQGQPAELIWAGPAPGLTGMQQLILALPAVEPASGLASLLLSVDGEPGTPYALPFRR